MIEPTLLDPQTPEEAGEWILAREFPLEVSLRAAGLIRSKLAARGFAEIDITFDQNDWRIVMNESASEVVQYHDIEEFVRGVVVESGVVLETGQLASMGIRFPMLDVRFRILPPVV